MAGGATMTLTKYNRVGVALRIGCTLGLRSRGLLARAAVTVADGPVIYVSY